jgi:hypothetical protein
MNVQSGLTFNADMAASAFLKEQPLMNYILEVLNIRSAQQISEQHIGMMSKILHKVSTYCY